MCDAFLILAQAPGGLSCFLLPRFTPDGDVNAIRIQRLKDKLGDRSNASSEVEFEGAHAGSSATKDAASPRSSPWARTAASTACSARPGSCVPPSRTRCITRVTGARSASARRPAAHAQRAGRPRARVRSRRRAGDAPGACIRRGDESRLFPPHRTPAAKFWVCKRGPALAAEAMEVLGGNGYVEEGPLARLYRQMPLNSIWEGSGNVMCLDVLRAARRESGCLDAMRDELALAEGGSALLDHFADATLNALRHATDDSQARGSTQRLALALQASLLVRFAPSFVADAFCATRLAADAFGGGAFGASAIGESARIVERAWPQ
jgi:putative acyl-CoA dehydrogenase